MSDENRLRAEAEDAASDYSEQPVGYAPGPARPPVAGKLLRCVQGVLTAFAILLVAVLGVFAGGITAGWVVLAAAVVVIAVLAVRVRSRPGWEPFAAGLWIGLGIGALVEGTCFAMLTSLERAMG